jgi:nitrogen regulatory protein PII
MSTRKKYGTTKKEMEIKKKEKEKLISKQRLFITLPQNGTHEIITEIKELLDKCEKGNAMVFLVHNDQEMKTSYKIDYNYLCEENLKNLVDPKNILLKK